MFNYATMLMADPAPAGDNTFLFIILALFLVAMFAFTVLPQRKKQRQMMEMSRRINVGDKIKTAGGIFGIITEFNEENNTFTIKSGNSIFEIDRAFVYSMEMLGIKPATEEIVEEIEPTAEDEIVEPVQPENNIFDETKTEESESDETNNKDAE